MKHRLAILLLWFLTALPVVAQAEADGRTRIDSDTLEMQGTADFNFFYFGGNVHVLGSDLDIQCDKLTVKAAREGGADATVGEIGAIEEIVAVGHVVILQADREARAGRVVVDPKGGTIHFLESPEIIQGDMRAAAYGFVFYTEDKRLEAINPPDFKPGQKEGRTTISLSNLPIITPEVPLERVTVDDRVNEVVPPAAEEAPTADPSGSGSAAPVTPEEGPSE